MRGYLVDVENGTHREVEAGKLEHYYRLIGCRCIEIVERKVGGKWYNVVCDDEGLLVEFPVASAYGSDNRPMLFGNIILFGIGDDYDLSPLTDDDVSNIKDNMAMVIDLWNGISYPVLVMSY